jgi:hypothetical protein
MTVPKIFLEKYFKNVSRHGRRVRKATQFWGDLVSPYKVNEGLDPATVPLMEHHVDK